MGGKNKSKFDFDSGSMFYYIFKKFKILFWVSFIAFVVSFAVSFMIRPKFKSTVIMFPTAGASISKSLVSEYYNSMKGSFNTLGEEDEAEQLLQVLNSEDLMLRIIDKFSLMKHYGIKKDSKYPITRLYKKFEKNFSFRRTEYMSVEINVLDWDPELAAKMANYTSDMIDTIMNKMQKERARQGYALIEREYENLRNHMTFLEDSMSNLSKFGVVEFESQMRSLSKAYGDALAKGFSDRALEIQKRIQVAAKYGPTYMSMNRQLTYDAEQLGKLFLVLLWASV